MRTLSAYNTTETSKAITTPFYLVDIDTIGQYSTFDTVTYFTKTFDASYPTKVSGISTKNNGAISCNISIKNQTLASYFINNNVYNKIVTVYKGYGTPIEADLIKLITGTMNTSNIKNDTLTMSISGKNLSVDLTPRLFVSYPDFGYLASGNKLFHL